MDVKEADMSGGVIIIIMIVSLVTGYLCNKSFNDINGEDGFLVLPGIVQAVFLLILLLNIPNPNVTTWFIVGVIGTILSYIVAIILCYRSADENGAINVSEYVKAIVAQVLLPLGSAILIIVIIVLLVNRKNNRRNRR